MDLELKIFPFMLASLVISTDFITSVLQCEALLKILMVQTQ